MGGGHGTGLLLFIFFLRWGGVSENSDFKIGSEIMGTYRGNLIRRGIEPTIIEENQRRISTYRGRDRGHVALFGLEYTLFSIISLEIGEDTEISFLGDYRGNIINSISPIARLCLFASV